VHFELTDDQVALQEGMRSFCAGRFGIEAVRAMEQGFDRDAWRALADMGVFSLRLPEREGGVDLGWADAVLVFEELGRALVPGPLVWTHLAASLVDGAASGDVVVGGIDRDDASGLIEHADALDQLLIVDTEGVWATPAASVEVEPVGSPLDPLTPVARLTGALPQGERLLDSDGAHQLWLQGAALVSGLLLGVSEAATDLAVAYAKERVQFGKPIGAFQAVKHILADMFTRTEVARGAVYAAGVTLDDPGVGSVERAVASAKLTAAEAAVGNGKSCIQVHGGMGYTWEVDAHLYFKRAHALEPSFGSRDDCAEVMADLLASAGSTTHQEGG
jgi:alkylation response protein AidB-like acyl-CoA dehydrogenase